MTHLHDLARTQRDGVASLVAGVETRDGEYSPTYVVSQGEPEGRSYAAALAGKYGLESGALKRARER